MRCFVAVDLNPKLTQKIEWLQKELAGLDTKLIEPENLHFTLKFLGEVDEGIVNKVKSVLQSLAANQETFNVNIAGIGAFPSEKFIRVVWIGGPELANLQSATNQALSDLFEKEKPTPHLTIARVRSQNHLPEIIEFINRHQQRTYLRRYCRIRAWHFLRWSFIRKRLVFAKIKIKREAANPEKD